MQVCVTYDTLEYINHFEQIVFELIYSRLRDKNEKQMMLIIENLAMAKETIDKKTSTTKIFDQYI